MNKLQQELNKEHTSKLLKTHPFDEKVSLPPPISLRSSNLPLWITRKEKEQPLSSTGLVDIQIW